MRVAPLAVPPLVGHKLLLRIRNALDRRGGNLRAQQAEQRRSEAMLETWGSFARWLERPGAGRLWMPFAAAHRWARYSCSKADLAWADQVLVGRYRLLTPEPIDLGSPPAWHRDHYTGRDWPLLPAQLIPLDRNDGGDIRTLWELSRSYHLIPLAKAWASTGDERYLTAYLDQVESWLDANPIGLGANWRSPMDAAIRAANWILAAQVFARAPAVPAAFWARLLANLRLTARFVARNLEWHPVYRGNHYVANAVGLLYVGAFFRDDPAGASWLRQGAAMLRKELSYQVGSDGVTGEASIAYHRLVTELFTYGGKLCELNLAGALPPEFWRRLRAMYRFIDAYLDSAGRAPLLGDADDGRLHQLCARAQAEPREHRVGLPRRYFPPPPRKAVSAEFPDGGFFVLRSPRGRCVIRCGPVGVHGAGSHDHNDQLSYELSLDGVSLVTDSGTFAYTRSLAERYAFRSTAAHNAIQLAGEEQNPIRADRPWRVLADRTRARRTAWRTGPEADHFEGRHQGFAHLPSGAICFRRVSVIHAREEWTIQDRVEGKGTEKVVWRTHFTPGTLRVVAESPGRWTLDHDALPTFTLRLETDPALELVVGSSRLSERYGVACTRPVLELQGSSGLPLTISLTIKPTRA